MDNWVNLAYRSNCLANIPRRTLSKFVAPRNAFSITLLVARYSVKRHTSSPLPDYISYRFHQSNICATFTVFNEVLLQLNRCPTVQLSTPVRSLRPSIINSEYRGVQLGCMAGWLIHEYCTEEDGTMIDSGRRQDIVQKEETDGHEIRNNNVRNKNTKFHCTLIKLYIVYCFSNSTDYSLFQLCHILTRSL